MPQFTKMYYGTTLPGVEKMLRPFEKTNPKAKPVEITHERVRLRKERTAKYAELKAKGYNQASRFNTMAAAEAYAAKWDPVLEAYEFCYLSM